MTDSSSRSSRSPTPLAKSIPKASCSRPNQAPPMPSTALPALPNLPPALRDAVLGWFDANGRIFAIRQARDPYAILVSEVMAQQTQIGRVQEYWTRWMRTFPTIESLASASPADVLRAWAGLGYNRRAINLQRAARVVVADHGGRIPRTVKALEALPGVGPYTA